MPTQYYGNGTAADDAFGTILANGDGQSSNCKVNASALRIVHALLAARRRHRPDRGRGFPGSLYDRACGFASSGRREACQMRVFSVPSAPNPPTDPILPTRYRRLAQLTRAHYLTVVERAVGERIAAVSKPWPADQIWPATHFQVARVAVSTTK